MVEKKMNLQSTKRAIEDKDYSYHAGTPLQEDSEHEDRPTKEPTRTPYRVKKCALSRVLEGKAAMAFSEAPKGSNCEREETLRYKTPTEKKITKSTTSTTKWNKKCTLTKRDVFLPNHTEVCSTSWF